MTNYIIYHQRSAGVDCPDGIAAAWVASRAVLSATFIGATYQSEPTLEPKAGDRVFIVDFSYPAAILESWADIGAEITVLDHHKTAQANLAGLERFSDRILCRFDMAECGATLAWRHFFPRKRVPAFLEFVRKRDLWLDCDLFAELIPETLVIYEAMAKIRHLAKQHSASEAEARAEIFRQYDDISILTRDGLLEKLGPVGEVLVQQKRERVRAIAAWATHGAIKGMHQLGVYRAVPMICLNPGDDRYVSDVGNYLLKIYSESPFVALLTSTGGIELRSRKGGFDVSTLAALHGGGGHQSAAGFKHFEGAVQ